MNTWQLLLQLRSLLHAATWADAPADTVFGRVLVSAGLTDDSQVGQLRFPLVMLVPGQATVDDDEPTLLEQEIVCTLLVRVSSDPWGEAALLGGPQDTLGSSDGRGLLEVEEELLDVVASLSGDSGVTIRLDWRSGVAPAQDDEVGYVVAREYRLTAWVTADRYYPGVVGL